jgi:putative DNA primase/helicase
MADGEEPGGPRNAQDQESNGIPGIPSFPRRSSILTQEEDARRSELCKAAAEYAGYGWRVIPVRWITDDGDCSCDRGPNCQSPGKHPVHDAWQNVGTCNPTDVASWWRPEPPEGVPHTEWFPFASIGVVTGPGSGVFVLDVDTYAGGDNTLRAYERRHGELPDTRIHTTSRGGQHFFFAYPEGMEIRNSAGRVLGKGLDVRGTNGFVVVPPSMGAHGAYELNPAHDVPPVPAPDWLLDLLRGYDQGQNGAAGAGGFPTEAPGSALRYAEAAVAAEAERMREAPEGERNDTLNTCAFSLGTLGGAGLLDEETAYAALLDAALAAGLTEDEIHGTFVSGWTAGLRHPRENIQWQAMGTAYPVCARTEFGNADRLAIHYGNTVRWCPDRKTWLRYAGGVWRDAGTDEGAVAAQQMIRALPYTEAMSYDDTRLVSEEDGTTQQLSPRADFIRWAYSQQTRKATTSAAELAKGIPFMTMRQDTFDASPMHLNVRNGVIDLSTGELLPHDPEDRMTLQAGAKFPGLGTPTPLWDAFLGRVQPDQEMRRYLRRVIGYCATGLTVEQVFLLNHGIEGANGKTVFEGVISAALGSYAQTLPVDTLMASSIDGRIPNDVARMAGKRFLAASETQAGKRLDEQRLKSLTGGDTIAARYMRAEWFDFKPVGKIWLATNHLPRLSDDTATWRRIHLIPWPVHIPEDERDGFLMQRLIAQELPAILAWIIRGAMDWHAEGLNPPEAVTAARRAYMEDEDIVGQFIAACLEVMDKEVNNAIGRSVHEIYTAFEQWCRIEHIKPVAQKTLTERIRKRGFRMHRAGGWAGFPALQVNGMFTPPA